MVGIMQEIGQIWKSECFVKANFTSFQIQVLALTKLKVFRPRLNKS
jgi:hypothetical protein